MKYKTPQFVFLIGLITTLSAHAEDQLQSYSKCNIDVKGRGGKNQKFSERMGESEKRIQRICDTELEKVYSGQSFKAVRTCLNRTGDEELTSLAQDSVQLCRDMKRSFKKVGDACEKHGDKIAKQAALNGESVPLKSDSDAPKPGDDAAGLRLQRAEKVASVKKDVDDLAENAEKMEKALNEKLANTQSNKRSSNLNENQEKMLAALRAKAKANNCSGRAMQWFSQYENVVKNQLYPNARKASNALKELKVAAKERSNELEATRRFEVTEAARLKDAQLARSQSGTTHLGSGPDAAKNRDQDAFVNKQGQKNSETWQSSAVREDGQRKYASNPNYFSRETAPPHTREEIAKAYKNSYWARGEYSKTELVGQPIVHKYGKNSQQTTILQRVCYTNSNDCWYWRK